MTILLIRAARLLSRSGGELLPKGLSDDDVVVQTWYFFVARGASDCGDWTSQCWKRPVKDT